MNIKSLKIAPYTFLPESGKWVVAGLIFIPKFEDAVPSIISQRPEPDWDNIDSISMYSGQITIVYKDTSVSSKHPTSDISKFFDNFPDI